MQDVRELLVGKIAERYRAQQLQNGRRCAKLDFDLIFTVQHGEISNEQHYLMQKLVGIRLSAVPNEIRAYVAQLQRKTFFSEQALLKINFAKFLKIFL
jgi:isochorismate hydrolase